ncbi:MAG: hypothetical protein QW520_02680 [Methanomassiliicoccales archaeon]
MKVIGLYTEDFQRFYQLVRLLKKKGEPFISLGREGKVPSTVGVVITTEAERKKVDFEHVVVLEDPEEAVSMAKCMLAGGIRFHTVVVGIDPGKNVGLAVFGEGRMLASETVRTPAEVPKAVAKILRCLTFSKAIARVGHGDPTKGNLIIREIWDMFDEIELVDETGTTIRSEEPDAEAAKRIAMTKGELLVEPPKIEPTPGELKDLKRLSRLESQGSVTISSRLARSVALGELTLTQAIAEQRRSERRIRPGSE